MDERNLQVKGTIEMNGGAVSEAGIFGRVPQQWHLIVLLPVWGLLIFLLDNQPNPMKK